MPAIAVAYPQIAKSHLQATHEVIATFFNGQIHAVGGKNITFPAMPKFLQQMDQIESVGDLTIAMLNPTVISKTQYKCQMTDGTPGVELWVSLDREVSVIVPKASADPDLNFRRSVEIWDMLFAIFQTQVKVFADRGIHNIRFDPVPFQVPHAKLAIVAGSYGSLVKARYKLN